MLEGSLTLCGDMLTECPVFFIVSSSFVCVWWLPSLGFPWYVRRQYNCCDCIWWLNALGCPWYTERQCNRVWWFYYCLPWVLHGMPEDSLTLCGDMMAECSGFCLYAMLEGNLALCVDMVSWLNALGFPWYAGMQSDFVWIWGLTSPHKNRFNQSINQLLNQ